MNSQIRLDRLLSNRGYASRREVRALLKTGRITIDGHVAQRVEQKVDPQLVLLDGEVLDPANLTLMLHKPIDYTCSHEAADSIFELLPERYLKRKPLLSCAGRLDKDVSGLVIISDDGELVHKIISPRNKVVKKYRVQLSNQLKQEDIEVLASGNLQLKGEETCLLPAQLQILNTHQAELCIIEGRYHQVKRMFAALGNHVEKLERIQIGRLQLADLEIGKYRILTKQEIAAILQSS